MEQLLKPEEVARKLAVSPKSVRQWLREGRLKGVRAGKLWRITKADLDSFLHSHTVVEVEEDQPGQMENPLPGDPRPEDRSWLDEDLSQLEEFSDYEWQPGELEKGRPVRWESGKGLVVDGGPDGN